MQRTYIKLLTKAFAEGLAIWSRRECYMILSLLRSVSSGSFSWLDSEPPDDAPHICISISKSSMVINEMFQLKN